MPAKCGNSPRENVGIVLSTIDDAPGNPRRNPSAISWSKFVRGISASYPFCKKENQGEVI